MYTCSCNSISNPYALCGTKLHKMSIYIFHDASIILKGSRGSSSGGSSYIGSCCSGWCLHSPRVCCRVCCRDWCICSERLALTVPAVTFSTGFPVKIRTMWWRWWRRNSPLTLAVQNAGTLSWTESNLWRSEVGLVTGTGQVVMVIEGTFPPCPSYGVTGILAELLSQVTAGRQQCLDVGQAGIHTLNDKSFLPRQKSAIVQIKFRLQNTFGGIFKRKKNTLYILPRNPYFS